MSLKLGGPHTLSPPTQQQWRSWQSTPPSNHQYRGGFPYKQYQQQLSYSTSLPPPPPQPNGVLWSPYTQSPSHPPPPEQQSSFLPPPPYRPSAHSSSYPAPSVPATDPYASLGVFNPAPPPALSHPTPPASAATTANNNNDNSYISSSSTAVE